MAIKTKIKVNVKTSDGKLLTFFVAKYWIEGSMLFFYDEFNNITKGFPTEQCEITMEGENGI